VDGRVCVDGGTIDNLPIAAAAVAADRPPPDLIVAVHVGSAEFGHEANIHRKGFAAVFMRSASVMMHALQAAALARWQGPPVLLVRPRVGHVDWFSFGRAREMIDAGYEAAVRAFEEWDAALAGTGGIYPRRAVRVEVDRSRCTGCGLCVALAPETMALDVRGKAYARQRALAWSPADGGFVGQCPTQALRAVPLAVPAVAVATPAGAPGPVPGPMATVPIGVPAAVLAAVPVTPAALPPTLSPALSPALPVPPARS
jgi:NTE family protein